MCGIVGAIAQRPVTEILLEGLRRLEYRGYDSAGVAVLNNKNEINRTRALGKVASLAKKLEEAPVIGNIGISHTRWATHGEPAERNAHPHISNSRVAIVHNGIIENYEELRVELKEKGYEFTSDTDTEVVVHLIEMHMSEGLALAEAVKKTIKLVRGAYALGVISTEEPDTLIAARQGSPLVLGLGLGETFIGSDIQAMLPVTSRFIYLENGDFCIIKRDGYDIFDESDQLVEREIKESSSGMFTADLGNYRHYMHKEIFEQPNAVQSTL